MAAGQKKDGRGQAADYQSGDHQQLHHPRRSPGKGRVHYGCGAFLIPHHERQKFTKVDLAETSRLVVVDPWVRDPDNNPALIGPGWAFGPSR